MTELVKCRDEGEGGINALNEKVDSKIEEGELRVKIPDDGKESLPALGVHLPKVKVARRQCEALQAAKPRHEGEGVDFGPGKRLPKPAVSRPAGLLR